jgi:hypothetical protein
VDETVGEAGGKYYEFFFLVQFMPGSIEPLPSVHFIHLSAPSCSAAAREMKQGVNLAQSDGVEKSHMDGLNLFADDGEGSRDEPFKNPYLRLVNNPPDVFPQPPCWHSEIAPNSPFQ